MVQPLAKRGEMDQGVLRFAGYSLVLVAKGYTLALLVGTPLGFLLGTSRLFARMARNKTMRMSMELAGGRSSIEPILAGFIVAFKVGNGELR